MPDNLQVPPALLAKIDQLLAMNHTLLQTFTTVAADGLKNGYNTTTVLGVVGDSIELALDFAEFDRGQLMILIAVAVLELAKAQNEGVSG
jgi:hypothetical protein